MINSSSLSVPVTLPTSVTGLQASVAMIPTTGSQYITQSTPVLGVGASPVVSVSQGLVQQNIVRQPIGGLPTLNSNIPVSSGARQTIIVINNNNPVCVQPLPSATMGSQIHTASIPSTVLTAPPSSSAIPLSVTNLPQISSAITDLSMVTQQNYNLSMPNIGPSASYSDTSDTEGPMPTFEELCRPIMEAEIAAGNVINVSVSESKAGPSSEAVASIPEPGVTPALLVTTTATMTSYSTSVQTTSSTTSLILSTETPAEKVSDNSVLVETDSVLNPNVKTTEMIPSTERVYRESLKSESEIQSEIVSSTTAEKVAGEPIPPQAVVKGTIEVGGSPRETIPRCFHTPTMELENQSDSSMSDHGKQGSISPVVKTPKSALEMMAAYAPIFLSPQQNVGTLTPQQLAQETTPTKSGSRFVRLLPKPTPPSSEKFNPAMFRKSPKSASPRRKQFNQQAKAILPKGFVISTFETSPAKKAASTLVDKAKQQAKGYCNILPRPPGYQASIVSPIKLPKKQVKSKQVRKNLQKDKSFNAGSKSIKSSNLQKKVSGKFKDKPKGAKTGNVNNNADVEIGDRDKVVDTDSDYTQSDDDVDTHGTDVDDAADTLGSDGDETQGTDGEGDDGNDTQGTDLDSQDDSQEEDEGHIADLMTASTTLR